MTRRTRIALAIGVLVLGALGFQLVRTLRAERAFAERVEQLRALAALVPPVPELESARAELAATLAALDARLDKEASGDALARAVGEETQRAEAQARLDAALPLLEEMRALLGGTQCQRLLAQTAVPPTTKVERFIAARDWTRLLAARASRERDLAQQAAWLGAAFDHARLRDDGTFLGAGLASSSSRDALSVLQSLLEDPAIDPALLFGELDPRLERAARPYDFRRVAALEVQRVLPVLEQLREAQAGLDPAAWLERAPRLENAAAELAFYEDLSRTGALDPASTSSTHAALASMMRHLEDTRAEFEAARADLARRAAAR